MKAQEWLDAFAHELGVDPPDEATMEALLAVASNAAHTSERLAAPIACYLIGLAGADVATALATSEAIRGD